MLLRRPVLAALPVLALAAAASPAAAAQQDVHVTCKGGAQACTARVNLAGGASNERVVVALPGSKLRLVSAQPSSASLQGAYSVSDQASRAGGKEYVFTLNAVEAIPSGSALVLKFRKPAPASPQIVRCKGSATSCSAKVSIAGGASNRQVVIQLPATDLGLASVRPSSQTLRGAYSISDQRLRAGDSEYVLRLSAPQGTPSGSYLSFSFTQI
jgi:hypothetical protein